MQKRIKIENQPLAHAQIKIDFDQNAFHIKPLGSLFATNNQTNQRRVLGLGQLALLEDELVIGILSNLDFLSLCRAAQTSKALLVFSSLEEIWKEKTLEHFPNNFEFHPSGSWKNTFWKLQGAAVPQDQKNFRQIPVDDLYSDALFNRAFVSHLRAKDQSRFLANTVKQIEWKDYSFERFESEFLAKNHPVLIKGVVSQWPAFTEWTRSKLLDKYGKVLCKTNHGVEMSLQNYLHYCQSVSGKEANPMYLFDNEFGERLVHQGKSILEDYSIPEVFCEDFFALLDPEDRPSFRWILVGPEKSGSGFHKDPNYTSAWNGLISGLKKWILYPPSATIPGVHPSEDGFTVETPESIIEWFCDFYTPNPSGIEVMQHPGDLLFIPSGWWHCALNLEETIAVTQNFVNRHNFPKVFKFLKSKPDQTLFNSLCAKMQTRQDTQSVLAQMQEKEEQSEKKPFFFNFVD